ncbi:MAG: GEVED domain-containing protein [Bacteroidetes bacterium]|nr:GEVED domain-containing protein [Bacteroidota bacterium]
MRKLQLLFITLLMITTGLTAQTTLAFHEDFELPGQDDSVTTTQTTVGVKDWNLSSTLHHQGLYSDTCRVKTAATTYLTSQEFSTIGNFYVILEFAQICKVDFLDLATIEVSGDGGLTWTQLTGAQYLGLGQFASNGNRFASNSYGALWAPSSSTTIPDNTWWKVEQFDVSGLIQARPNAKIRFKLADAGTAGSNNNYGWCLDDIMVIMAPYEIIPPVITLLNPVLTGNYYGLGPFTIKAKITDFSGIDTAYLVYTINGGVNDTVGMTHLGGDTMVGYLPATQDQDVVCWYVVATDNTPGQNLARNPVSSCNSFTALAPATLPYFNNFDNGSPGWTTSQTGTTSLWQLGVPAYGSTNTTHSGLWAWDVNLINAYANNANCMLLSPVFDFTNITNATLSFWLNYNTETTYDGTRVDYSFDDITWVLLGTLNDPQGTNWYNHSLISTNLPGWGGNSGGWENSTYYLSVLNNQPQVRFRFVFTSDGSQFFDGVSMDDFSIILPAPQSASLASMVSPVSGCGLQNENVTIKIKNTGLQAINGGLTASYRKGNGAVVTEPVPSTIAPADSLVYSFTTPVNLSANQADSTFTIKAWITLTGDPNHLDDTLSKTILSKHLPDIPLVANMTYIPYGTFGTLTAISSDTVKWYSAPVGGYLLATGPVYVTYILYSCEVFYVESEGTNGCLSSRVPDSVCVTGMQQIDGGVQSMLSPNTGYILTAAETVKIRIKNNGLQAFSNFQVSYSINGGTAVNQPIAQTLSSGDTLTVSFTQTADLSAFATYEFKAWITVPGDLVHQDDTVSKTVVNQDFVYCTSAATYPSDDDIGNVTISNISNGNPLPTTNNSTATHIYTNFTQTVAPIYLAKGQTYPFSVSSIYSAGSYNCCVKIFVDWNHNGTFEPTTETAWGGGPKNGLPFTGSITVPINAVSGLTRFRVVLEEVTTLSSILPCGYYTWGETEDYTAQIADNPQVDASCIAILSPATIYNQSSSVAVKAVIRNDGTNPINNMTLGYTLDGGTPVTMAWSGNLSFFDTDTIVFPSVLFPSGLHNLCVFTSLPGDVNPLNDTLCHQITGLEFATLPWTDHFDDSIQAFTATTFEVNTNWMHGSPIPGLFPTQGAYSQPNVWSTNLFPGQYAAHANCLLTSPVFEWTGVNNAILSFWYTSISENGQDGTRLEYSSDFGSTWQVLGSIGDSLSTNWYNTSTYTNSLPAWSGSFPSWIKATYKLNIFNNISSMQFRFIFTSDGSMNYGGMAIDDFSLTFPNETDAGIDSITQPTGSLQAGLQDYPSCILKNFGTDTIQLVNIAYQIDNNAPVSETWVNSTLYPLAYEGTVPFIFSTPFIVPAGNYTLKIYTQLPNDEDHLNDTIIKTFTGFFPCQQIVASLDTLQLHPLLNDSSYLDVCYGDTLKLVGKGIYPENDINYHQSDQTSVFHWNFGDGTTATGKTVYHHYTEASGYKVILWIEDSNACQSLPTPRTRVRISSNPFASIQPIPVYCQGNTIEITLGYSDTNTIKLNPQPNYVFDKIDLKYDTAKFIPDGGAIGGNCYDMPILVTRFDSSAHITQASDIESVRINMEHSYVGDLAIKLICPNGQTTVLKEYIQQGGAFLGQPLGGDNHNAFDCSNSNCLSDPLQNPPGTGWTYTWTMNNPVFNELQAYAGTGNCTPPPGQSAAQLDSSSYMPNQSFSNLIGCPLNGEWRVQVCDYWAIDNGWVFWWDLKLDSTLVPVSTASSLPLDTIIWSGPNIIQASENHIIIQPAGSGNFTYQVTAIDAFGCSYDTTFLLQISMSMTVDCGPDLSYPQPASTVLSAVVSGALPPLTFIWSTGDATSTINVNTYNTTTYYLTVTDAHGCTGMGSVTVEIGNCPFVQGEIQYNNNLSTPMTNTLVELRLNNALVGTDTTSLDGYYQFLNICQPGSYELIPFCNKPNGGINASDALLAMKYFVGTTSFSSLQFFPGRGLGV